MLPPPFVPRFRELVWLVVMPVTWIADARMPRLRTVRKSNFLKAPHVNDAPWTRGRIFHTGHSLRERVRPQAPISRSSRLAGREFVRANGGRPGQAMPTYGNSMAVDPLTNGGPRARTETIYSSTSSRPYSWATTTRPRRRRALRRYSSRTRGRATGLRLSRVTQ